jgi:hypothetical protein
MTCRETWRLRSAKVLMIERLMVVGFDYGHLPRNVTHLVH